MVALLGPNGAGKTSALNAIAGLLPSDGGTVHVGGRDLSGRSADARARAGLALVPDDRGLFPELSVADHLWLAAHHRPRPAELEEVHRLFPVLGERRGQRAGTLSGGEAQMLSIAVALLGRPTVLLIDELSFGLAPSIVGQLLGRCRQLADERGLGILLVEQFIDLVLDVADRALVLRSGVVALEGGAAGAARRAASGPRRLPRRHAHRRPERRATRCRGGCRRSGGSAARGAAGTA